MKIKVPPVGPLKLQSRTSSHKTQTERILCLQGHVACFAAFPQEWDRRGASTLSACFSSSSTSLHLSDIFWDNLPSAKPAIIFSLIKLRPLLKCKKWVFFLCMEQIRPQGHGLMCIFDELGILLCTHTAENHVFANRLPEQVAVIPLYSISLLLQSPTLWDSCSKEKKIHTWLMPAVCLFLSPDPPYNFHAMIAFIRK